MFVCRSIFISQNQYFHFNGKDISNSAFEDSHPTTLQAPKSSTARGGRVGDMRKVVGWEDKNVRGWVDEGGGGGRF